MYAIGENGLVKLTDRMDMTYEGNTERSFQFGLVCQCAYERDSKQEDDCERAR